MKLNTKYHLSYGMIVNVNPASKTCNVYLILLYTWHTQPHIIIAQNIFTWHQQIWFLKSIFFVGFNLILIFR